MFRGRLVWKLLNILSMNGWNQTYAHIPNTVTESLSLTVPRERVNGTKQCEVFELSSTLIMAGLGGDSSDG